VAVVQRDVAVMGAPGCDDAPLVNVGITDKYKDVTIIVPYYENPEFFKKQLAGWFSYPHDLSKHVRFIVVDDGSPMNPAEDLLRDVAAPYQLRLFRIEVDVRWNWLAARNIGANHADTKWIMLTDMDHVVDAKILKTLVRGDHLENIIYRFSRRDWNNVSVHPHPNSWFMTKEMFWKVGGYDEALSGYYGTDGEYRRRCAATAIIRIMVDKLVRHEHVGDSSTTMYKRKQPEDARGKQIVRSRPANWRPRTLSFPYHEVQL
jgi:glycosyltransferase involved in cell wall biosynthesis